MLGMCNAPKGLLCWRFDQGSNVQRHNLERWLNDDITNMISRLIHWCIHNLKWAARTWAQLEEAGCRAHSLEGCYLVADFFPMLSSLLVHKKWSPSFYLVLPAVMFFLIMSSETMQPNDWGLWTFPPFSCFHQVCCYSNRKLPNMHTSGSPSQ